MTDLEQSCMTRAVDALEAIAEHMGVLATMALSSNVETQPKRPRGRPRKDATVHVVGGAKTIDMTPEQMEAAVTKAVEPAAPVISEAERAEAFGKLKSALKECLALHGEEVARQRLQFPKFSEVPYEAIPATIERLAA
jgi:hypothetical protein